jgi:hypothetical protein
MAMAMKFLLFTTAALVLLVVSVGAVADPDESNPPSKGSTQIASIEPGALDALGLLRQARGQGDALPTGVAERMHARAPFGANPSLSRVAIGNATNSVYVVPAAGRVCASLTVGDGANLSCPEVHDVANGKAAPTTVGLGPSGVAVYGLVPDGVESVSIQTGVTSSDDLVPEGNAYYTVYPVGTPLRTVRYTGPSGSVEFPITDPAEAFED